MLLLSSCSLDQHDKSKLDYDNIKNKSDISGVRIGAYSMARYLYTGTNAYLTDYATDLFTELVNAGTRGIYFTTFTLSSSDRHISSIWNDAYRTISRINTFLDNVDNIEDSDGDVLSWKGEMYLLRAMIYRELAVRFCKDYEPTTAATDYGVPLITSYNTEYAGGTRGSLGDTYNQILKDIAEAEKLLLNEGVALSTYLTKDCVDAIKAQVALDMHDYDDAITYADKLISSDKYKLSTTKSEFAKLWQMDNSTEVIFMFDLESSNLEPESQYTDAVLDNTDMSFIDETSGSRRVSVAPCGWLTRLYAVNDWRRGVYVSEGDIVASDGVATSAFYINKFDGSVNKYHSRPKVFTLAQMYMIKAEAEYMLNGEGAVTLSEFREGSGNCVNRVEGGDIFKAIQDECAMEFLGEGRRLVDIKRWRVAFTRDIQSAVGFDKLIAQRYAVIDRVTQVSSTVTVPANYWGLTFPIPIREFGLNPELNNAQNEGY